MIKKLLAVIALLAAATLAVGAPLAGTITIETSSNPSTNNDAIEFDLSSNASIDGLETQQGGIISPNDYTITENGTRKTIQFKKNRRKQTIKVIVSYTGSATPSITNEDWKDNLPNPTSGSGL